MSSKSALLFLLGGLVAVGIILATIFYTWVYGTPWGKKTFESSVRKYIESNHYAAKGEYELSTSRSIKSGDYSSWVKLKSGEQFAVKLDSEGHLYDNLAKTILEKEVSINGTTFLRLQFNDQSSATLSIEVWKSGSLNNLQSYSEASDMVKETSIIYLNINEALEKDSIKKCYQTVEWFISNKYQANYYFTFTNKSFSIETGLSRILCKLIYR